MGNIWVLFKNNIKVSVIKKPLSFLLGLLSPIAILFIMLKLLNFSSGYIPIGVIDKDNSSTSKAIVKFLSENEIFSVVNIKESEKESSFAESKIYILVEFDKGFESGIINGKESKVNITTREVDNTDEIIKSILSNEIVNIKNLGLAANGNKEVYSEALNEYINSGELEVVRKSLSDVSSDYTMSQMFIGFIIFFMLIRGVSGVNHYYEEKEDNIFSRFFVAPVKAREYYLADFLSNYAVVLIQGIAGIIIIDFVGINTGLKSTYLFIILATVGLISVSLAMCVRSFFSRGSECGMAFNFITMVFIMVGGCFIPASIMPSNVEKISHFIPISWAIKSVNSLQVGNDFVDVVPYISIMILFAIVFLGIAVYKTSIAEKKFV